ncbi:MAG: Na+/H+ antiporter subunit E [Anaerolineae bacterium]|jgi:multicomponent Na+:H+ antiporter subunit E|nr:Na+/H+ antiporter subunit E [Anaerolineae bacterium]
MGYVWTILAVTAAYLALTGNLAVNNILVGVLIASVIALLLRPTRSPVELRRVPRSLLALLQYGALLAYDIIRSGLNVARIVLDPKLPIRPGILAVPSECETDLGIALSSHALSVTPGEIVVGVDQEGTLYIHCLDASHAADTIGEAQALRRRLLSRILE